MKKKNCSNIRVFRVLSALLLLFLVSFFAKQTVYAEIAEGRGSFRMQVGQRRQLQSQGGSAPYRWSTSNRNVVVIDSSDIGSSYATVRAVGEGTATVRLESDKFIPTWYGGDTDTFVETWTVTVTAASNTSGGNNNNTTTGTDAGANTGSGNTVTVKKVKLNKSSMKIKIGNTKSLTATLRPAGASGSLTWTSSKPKVATVNANGQVTALKAGKTKITVMTSNGKKAVCTVRVIKPPVKKIKLNFSKIVLDYDGKATLRYTISPANADSKVTWKSSNTKVAKVSKKGIITARKAGKTTITVKASSGVTAKCKVTVLQKPKKVTLNKKTLTLKEGDTKTLVAKVKPKKASASLRWSSSDSSVASVDSSGNVSAKKAGTTKITVKTVNGKKATCTVKVTAAEQNGNTSGSSNSSGNTVYIPAAAVNISGAISYLQVGGKMSLHAAVSPSNATDAVSWSSSNGSVASVSSAGVVTGLKKGGVTITAKAGNRTASVKIAVVSGDVYDVSKGEILVLGDNVNNNTVKYCGKEYTYNIAEGVTIVQSNPAQSNFIRIGGGKVTFANVHISGNRVNVVNYSRLEDSPYKGNITIEFMDGTENYFSAQNAPIYFSNREEDPIQLILTGNGKVDLYSAYGPALSGEKIIIQTPNLTLHES